MINFCKFLIKRIFLYFHLDISEISSKDSIKLFLNNFKTFDIGFQLIRIGDKNDGGYLLPNILDRIDLCISPGVGASTAFEKNLKSKKINSILIDHTIQKNAKHVAGFKFIKKKLNTYNDKKNITLKNLVKEKKNLLLQMDIEGGEYEIIQNCDPKILKKFNILIIEFHHLNQITNKHVLNYYSNVFKKLNNQFILCHFHPNNGDSVYNIHSYIVPETVELTYINNKFIKHKNRKQIEKKNHDLDSKCDPNKKDIRVNF